LNDFAAALRDLNASGIRYVIVGGLAVIRHGAVRATKDVGAAVAMDGDNLARLAKLIERWHATNPDGTPLRTTKLAPGAVLALRTSHCLVDILAEELLQAPFDEVLARADVKRIDGVEAPICSLADLVAMKRATGRGTDLLDLERLSDAHGALPGDGPQQLRLDKESPESR
jgi:predicted nucleotidyltransferase